MNSLEPSGPQVVAFNYSLITSATEVMLHYICSNNKEKNGVVGVVSFRLKKTLSFKTILNSGIKS